MTTSGSQFQDSLRNSADATILRSDITRINKGESMRAIRFAARLAVVALIATPALAERVSTDPLAAIDLNRTAIVGDIVKSFDADFAKLSPTERAQETNLLAKRLAGLRADKLLAASLASTRASLDSILDEAEKSRDKAVSRASAKALGSANADLVYTPLTPCRLIDTRGFGAPIQGGVFAPNVRRSYAPNGLCGLPVTGVATILITFTTENLTPNSGGYLAILAPATPVTASVDVFNLGSEWSASNTAVSTGPAAQFDVFVAVASAHVIVDVLGYFAPPQGGFVSSITAGPGLTGGTITATGTIGLDATQLMPIMPCMADQIPKWNGMTWACGADNAGVGVVTASPPLVSTGGTTPNVSLAGVVPVANGGTGAFVLAPGAVLLGSGSNPVTTATPGINGQVFALSGATPAWTSSPSLPGDVTVGGQFKYASPQGRTYWVGAQDFVAATSATTVADIGVRAVGRYVSAGPSPSYLAAPIHLPDGALVTGYSCNVFDNSATNDILFIGIYYVLASGGANLFCGFSSTAGSNTANQAVGQICNGLIDNNQGPYYITANLEPACGINCRITSCRINYTVTKPD